MSRMWEDHEIAEVRRHYGSRRREPVAALAQRLGRTVSAIQSKAAEIGVGRRKRSNPEISNARGVITERLRERAEREARITAMTPGMIVLGDPGPGRSALDGWVQQGEPNWRSHDRGGNEARQRRPWNPATDGKRGAA